jgi:hypothetical protein
VSNPSQLSSQKSPVVRHTPIRGACSAAAAGGRGLSFEHRSAKVGKSAIGSRLGRVPPACPSRRWLSVGWLAPPLRHTEEPAPAAELGAWGCPFCDSARSADPHAGFMGLVVDESLGWLIAQTKQAARGLESVRVTCRRRRAGMGAGGAW